MSRFSAADGNGASAVEQPKEWQVVALDDPRVFTTAAGLWTGKKPPFVTARVIRNTNFRNDGEIDYSDVAEIEVEQRHLEAKQLQRGDIIIERSGGGPKQPVGRVVLFERDEPGFAFSNFTARLRVEDRQRVLPQFVLYSLLRFHLNGGTETLQRRTTGIRNLEFSDYLKTCCPCPPLAEQRAIAGMLGKIRAAVAAQQAIIDRTAELKAALMAKLFTEGTRGEPLKETEIGTIPKSWDVRPCEEVCERISVGIVVRPAQYYEPDGVTCFRSANIRADMLDESNCVYISEESNAKLRKSILKTGDVLIVRTGYPGTSCVVPEKYAGANCIDLVFARCKSAMNSHFLSRFINSPMGKRQVITGNNSAQQHFNVGAVKALLAPVPSLAEQADIVSKLEVIDSRANLAQFTKTLYDELFAAMLDELMTGRIRVNGLDLATCEA